MGWLSIIDSSFGSIVTQLAYTGVISLLTMALVSFFIKLYRVRSMFREIRDVHKIPILPHSFLFGHLPFVIKTHIRNKMPSDVSAIQHFTPLIEAYPEAVKYGVLYFDPWPIGFPMLVAIEPAMMSQITSPSASLPKFWSTVWHPFEPFTNDQDLVHLEGREWKESRAMFNPGFSHRNLISLVPQFLEEVHIFREKLFRLANTGKIVEIEPLVTSLTTDVISRAILGVRLESQRRTVPLVTAMSKQVSMLYFSLDLKKVLNPLRPIKHWWYRNVFRKEALAYIQESIKNENEMAGPKTVLGLAFAGQKNESNLSLGPPLTPSSSEQEKLVNHIKMFMFAGHDSTAVTLAFVYYHLFQQPDLLERVRKEHDEVFGSDTSKVSEQLTADPALLNKLTYTFCVIKETLRLYPPFGGTVRSPPEGFHLVHPETGKQCPAHGFMAYSSGVTAAKDPRYFRHPLEFIPERWLDSAQEEGADSSLPPLVTKAAWRPFEVGPRKCIGQELVFIELEMVLALTIREFNFQNAYKDGAPTWWGQAAYQCEVPEHPVSARIKDRLPVLITTKN